MGLTVAFLCPSPAVGQDVSFTAEVSSNTVTLGSSVQLTLTVNGVTNLGDMQLPPLESFDVQYIGPSTHVSIVNGKYYSSKSFSYSLLPQKTGKFIIQPFNVTINGANYSTNPIELEVVDAATTQPNQVQPDGVSLKDKINLVLRVPKKEVYINEALPVKVMMLVNTLSVRDIRYPEINNIGFIAGNYGQPKQYQQVINGVRYDIVEFDTVVYPTRTGELMLGPAKLECNLLVKSTAQRSLGGLFNDDFFNVLFDQAEKRPMTLESEPVTINVLNLPEDGKPDDFSGAVGQFDFDVNASPIEVRVGDPITLRMNVRGRGNLKAIEFPDFSEGQDFKVYKPIIKEEEASKSLEQVILPKSETIKEVPAVNFSYFDPELGKYQTITKGPIAVHVTPGELGQTYNVVDSLTLVQPQEEKLGEDIVFIKNNLGTLVSIGQPVYKNPIYYFMVLLCFGLWVWGVGHFKWTHRLATDKAYARKLLAPKQAKKDLLLARQELAHGNIKEFYDHLFKALQGYLANKFHLSAGIVSAAVVKERLTDQAHAKTVEAIGRIFEECESVRYAGASYSAEAMQESLHETEKAIDYLERNVK